jgi:Uncharacterized conserved protein
MSDKLKVYGQHDHKTLNQMYTCLKTGDAYKGVLCADGHLGYAHPIGGVVAYKDQISISGVGFDIACGNKAIMLDTRIEDIQHKLPVIAADIAKTISFGIGRTNQSKKAPQFQVKDDLWDEADCRHLKNMAYSQLGTVGSGNHYVDVFSDQQGRIWIGVHFGSRGLGHKLTTKALKDAGGKDGMEVPPTLVDVKSEIGVRYLAALELAGAYAYQGRDWVVETVRGIIGGRVLHSVHNHHNWAWREEHNGESFYVVRKGATPAFPGQEGFVGGSMGDDAVIIEGVDSQESRDSLYSTIHGAGRVMGRNVAKKTLDRKVMEKWLHDKKVIVHGGDLDESPMAYRRLNDVLKEHEGTIKINHVLSPIIVVMAGGKEVDPYKD